MRCPPTLRTRSIGGCLAATIGVVALIVAACAPDVSPVPSTTTLAAFPGRLSVLTGAPGARQLVAYQDGRAPTLLGMPASDATWISGDGHGTLAVTEADGTILVRDSAATTWQTIDPGTSLEPFHGRPVLATVSPDGRLAAIIASVETARASGILLVDPTTDEISALPLDVGLEGSPPAWLGSTILAVPGRDRDVPRIVVLDTRDGSTSTMAGAIRTVGVSPDGSIIALIRGEAAEVEVWRAGPWIAAGDGDTPPSDETRLAVLRPPSGAVRPAAMALDASGDHLAVAWGDADGATTRVTIHAGREGWAVVAMIMIPATSAIPAMAWLP
jgi:hypothetical protein